MLTNNMYAMTAANLLGGTTATVHITKTNGDRQKLYGGATDIAVVMNTVAKSSAKGVILTNGTTPPTPEDLCFTGTQFKTFTAVAEVTVTETEDGAKCTGIYTVTNTGTADFTVSEVCLYSMAYTGTSSNSGLFMLDRTVLDAPVTIPVGGVGVITYTISMNYPTE